MPETFTAHKCRAAGASPFRHKSGFNAADVPAPRGRPPDGTRVDGREITRGEYEDLLAERHSLRAAGDLRAQAALYLLRDGRIDETVRMAAVVLARRAAYTKAQIAHDGSRRRGDAAQTARARQDRDRAGVTGPSEIAVAQAVAASLPARAPRRPALDDKRGLAALAVESEVQRLRRLDKRERQAIAKTARQLHEAAREIALAPARQIAVARARQLRALVSLARAAQKCG